MTSALDNLVQRFLTLAKIDAVSLAERPIADAVSSLLRNAGIHVEEDASAAQIGGTAGNLLCFPPGFDPQKPALMLTAHLDTVLSTHRLRPVLLADRITSDGTTILGADNRAGLSVLVDLLLNCTRGTTPHRNFFCVFTVGEEIGLLGAGSLDLSRFQISAGIVFDCSKRPGVYIRESVGLHLFTARIVGKSAHSGVNPEEGVNAIVMASQAISRLRLGRLDEETTANVGQIRGGEAVNAVPERAIVEGEVRSFDPKRIMSELSIIEQIFHESVAGKGRLEFETTVDFEPYVLAPDLPVVMDLERALVAAGCIPQPIRYTGGSDANKYNAKGIPTVNIGIGAQKPHSNEEFILLEDLHRSYDIAKELIRA
jgi:tripeptide aminopeptidase